MRPSKKLNNETLSQDQIYRCPNPSHTYAHYNRRSYLLAHMVYNLADDVRFLGQVGFGRRKQDGRLLVMYSED